MFVLDGLSANDYHPLLSTNAVSSYLYMWLFPFEQTAMIDWC